MVCNPFAAKLLRHLYRPSHICDIKQHTIREYQQGWRKSWETTSSLPSGIHFRDYITGTFNPEILVINATLADIPLQTRFSPDRWRKGLNVLLEKSPGNFNVEKLCIILLFEADFNHNNKWVGRAIMLNAELARMSVVEQYSSWKNQQLFNVWINCYSMTWSGSKNSPQHYAQMMQKAVMITLHLWWQLFVFVNWVCPLQMFLVWCQLSTRWNITFGWHTEIQVNLAVERNGGVLQLVSDKGMVLDCTFGLPLACHYSS